MYYKKEEIEVSKPERPIGKLESGMNCVRCKNVPLKKKKEKSRIYFCPNCGAHYGI